MSSSRQYFEGTCNCFGTTSPLSSVTSFRVSSSFSKSTVWRFSCPMRRSRTVIDNPLALITLDLLKARTSTIFINIDPQISKFV